MNLGHGSHKSPRIIRPSLVFLKSVKIPVSPRPFCCLWFFLESHQNFVTSVKLKSFTFIAGTTMSNDSSPHDRTGMLMDSTFDSM